MTVAKRRGFGAILVLSFVPLILGVLALCFSIVMKFHNISFIVLREQQQQEALRAGIRKIISDELPSEHRRLTFFPINNPSLESLLLPISTSEFEVYSMNYTLDALPPDILKFPPSKKSENEEHNFFVRATRKSNTKGIHGYRIDAAVEISGDIPTVLWWREYTLYRAP